jgi:hypothetical protein
MDDWRMVIELLQQFVNRKPENFRTINEIAKQILLARSEEIYGCLQHSLTD